MKELEFYAVRDRGNEAVWDWFRNTLYVDKQDIQSMAESRAVGNYVYARMNHPDGPRWAYRPVEYGTVLGWTAYPYEVAAILAAKDGIFDFEGISHHRSDFQIIANPGAGICCLLPRNRYSNVRCDTHVIYYDEAAALYARFPICPECVPPERRKP